MQKNLVNSKKSSTFAPAFQLTAWFFPREDFASPTEERSTTRSAIWSC